MLTKEFFPERTQARPMIYAYKEDNPKYEGFLKIGYTEVDVEKRVAQQYPTKRPDGLFPYEIVYQHPAMKNDGSSYMDHDVHKILLKKGVENVGGEWFRCTVDDIKASVIAVETGTTNIENRTISFPMRPEQEDAVNKTIEYFKSSKKDAPTRTPKFLWNAKMRFGKTFASYQLAKKMGLTKILVLTFKPAVEVAWEEDLMSHTDFEGWQFICRNGMSFDEADKNKPIVCFGSFQDYLGTNNNGGIKARNEWVHTTNWDIVIFDEYHFGAWRENAKNLFDTSDEDENFDFDFEKYKSTEADNAYNETFLPITTSYYLFLSGTPFRAINSGEFIEDQIYNWTYSDEQRAKENWGDKENNPYASLPRMVMLTYRIPEEIQRIAKQGEFNEFDLNVFFSAKGKGEDAVFTYENEVQKWLDLIRGSYLPSTVDDMKLGQGKRPPMPYSDSRLLNALSHTFWFLPNVASCYAMYNLLKQKKNTFYHHYNINVCAGTKAGVGAGALEPIRKSMGNPLETKTITLSCGKLTTGITIKPLTGIFMLRNLQSPETYFQAAFRVQSPWTIKKEGGEDEIVKKECYVFDFALDRALKQISDYSCQLNVDGGNPEKKVEEFINFLPVLAYDGSSMKEINAQDVLDIAMAGTSATLLAKRWESALLVNVDNETLARLMANEKAMEALMKIEGFRSLNSDIETIINKSEAVKKAKKEKNEDLTKKEKKELSEAEKEYKSMRKQIQEKLIKFATRVPIFMYLTDYREYSLKDVIRQVESGLFKKVTGLDVEDFNILVELNVFNSSLMNDAIFKFKRYEDASLSYTGIDRHDEDDVGGWDITIKREEYETLFKGQQESMNAPIIKQITTPTINKKIKTNATKNTPKLSKPVPQPQVIEPSKVVEPTKPKVDTSGVAIDTKVKHKIFGEGKVIELTNSAITLKFNQGEKRFVFPDAFESGFLQLL